MAHWHVYMILLKGHKARQEKIKSMKKPPIYNLDQVKSVKQPNSRKRERILGRKGKTKRHNHFGHLARNQCCHTRSKGYNKYGPHGHFPPSCG